MFPEIEQFDQWLARKSPYAITHVNYTSDLTLFFTWAELSPNQITVRKVDEYIEQMQEAGYSA